MIFVLELPSPGKRLRLNVDMPAFTVVVVVVWYPRGPARNEDAQDPL
jgi:hypothetical protein